MAPQSSSKLLPLSGWIFGYPLDFFCSLWALVHTVLLLTLVNSNSIPTIGENLHSLSFKLQEFTINPIYATSITILKNQTGSPCSIDSIENQALVWSCKMP